MRTFTRIKGRGTFRELNKSVIKGIYAQGKGSIKGLTADLNLIYCNCTAFVHAPDKIRCKKFKLEI